MSEERDGPTTVTPAVTVGPWYFATLIVECPVCFAEAGARCTWEDGRGRRNPHLLRYSRARELAGFPLAPRRADG